MAEANSACCHGLAVMILASCGGKITPSNADSTPDSSFRADAGSDSERPENDTSSIDATVTCSIFETIWRKSSCEGCVQGAYKQGCEAILGRISQQCEPSYLCATKNCLCVVGTCGGQCNCISGCLPLTPNACTASWGEFEECVASACDGKC